MLVLMLAGAWHCKGREKQANGQDPGVVDTIKEKAAPPKILTLPDGTQVVMDPRTEIRPMEGFGKANRDVTFDGEGVLIVHDGAKPFVIHTRNLVVTVEGKNARIHVDAFASSPGEEVDLLEGKLKVIKSYHSSTDNSTEVLQAGEMVMINRDIDLMEKETLKPEEQKVLELKFPK
ncbi:FecR domain-containing protein [Flavitalea sp. BT771]|uniref:FecR domain-containing protein n=1 Tax=Flavitalea sp. BT771 TaxID=3063329 RepID=UPI0026E2A44B|nr:FecR domain-containing protein [Flavitalea sp. BT771]MDO6431886.1 FecR domain-containing protein [Flavitalea sp. BT771]MDV6220795.1 FecR domain-containing protein [Flavitalea sp. BT771]